MGLFVSLDSMTRGSLAGARWSWEGTNLTIRLSANGKDALEELIPQVRQSLFARFGVEVTIQVEAGTSLEGKALFGALDSMRDRMMEKLPAQAAAEPEHPTAALCYDFQMLPHLDTDPFDIPVDLVLYV